MTARRSLYDNVEPRPDVLKGQLNEAIFAASLDEVVSGTASDAYGNPERFFTVTYPSAGLKSLLREVLGRLSGKIPDAPPVIRLETNLGGGKTHNLIAAYHAARGGLSRERAEEFVEADLLPNEPVPIGVLVGTAVGATDFPERDGIKPKTAWGHLALGLGGKEAYRHIQGADENLTAPGSQALAQVLGNRPALLLIDELAAYLVKASGVTVGESTLANQTISFLMSLIDAVAGKDKAVLVLSSTQITDPFGKETSAVLDAVSHAMSVIHRREHVLRPSEESDLPAILSRRLFLRIDERAATEVAAAYAEAASRATAAGVELPERMRSAWAQAVQRSYPFHPDLITILDRRLSTIPTFQRTRGALRLLARTVRILWNSRPYAELIHPHHIDMSDKDTVEDLTSRLDRATFEPVVRTDIAGQPGGEPSHADEVDQGMGAEAPYARRLATAAYLWSLTREVPGVPAGDLIGSVLTPSDDPRVLAKALEKLEEKAWYLHRDNRGYSFSTEASLAKLLHDAEGQITPSDVRKQATEILEDKFKDSGFKVHCAWKDSKVPDAHDQAWLVLVHWEQFGATHGVKDASVVPPQVMEIWEKKPDGGLREYRNRMVFLVPSSATHDAMVAAVRRKLAVDYLVNNPEMLRSLPPEKQEELRKRKSETNMEAVIAVCNHMSILYVPEAPGLNGHYLQTVTTSTAGRNQTEAVLEFLSTLKKTLTANDPPLDPNFVKARLGSRLREPISTAELVMIFARQTDLPIVLDTGQIRALIQAGLRAGCWDYLDAAAASNGWATKERPEITIEIAEYTYLYPPGSAPAKKEDAINDHEEEVPDLPPPSDAPREIEAEGKADFALSTALLKAAERRSYIAEVSFTIDESGPSAATELAKLLTVIPRTASKAEVGYEIKAEIELPDGHLKLDFKGPANEYAELKSVLEHYLRKHESRVKAMVTGRFAQPVEASGEEIKEISRAAADTGPSRCSIKLILGEQA